MQRFKFLGISSTQIAALVAVMTFTTGAYSQTITTFDVPNATGTVPQGINLSGKIAGYYSDTIGGGTHGFLRKPDGTITTFDVQPTLSLQTFAYGINSSGEIVGTVQDLGSTFGFLRRRDGTIVEWNASGQPPISALTEPGQPGNNCVVDGAGALAINAFAQTIGSVGIGCNTGYLRQWDGTFTYFQVAGPPETVAPQAVNLAGQTTGWYKSNGTWDGFLRQPDGTVVTFHVPDSTSVIPQGINLHGQIAGYYGDANDSSVFHGFLRRPDGTFLTFDPAGSISTQVTAINDKGEVTGSYMTADGMNHGFLRTRQGIVKSFDAVGVGNLGTFPKAINNRGQIAGYYQDATSALHGFVRGE